MNVPSTPGNARLSIAAQQTSNGVLMMFAPRSRMRSSFVSGAVSIATTVHEIPASRAAYATPCPALPALIVHTPLLRASGVSIATAFAAPRNLNALIGCRFSSFSQISGLSLPLSRRSVSGLTLAGLGGALVWRGATGHCAVYNALGISTNGHATRDDSQVSVPYGKGIRVEKSVTVNASPEQLYAFWRNFENLPRFM